MDVELVNSSEEDSAVIVVWLCNGSSRCSLMIAMMRDQRKSMVLFYGFDLERPKRSPAHLETQKPRRRKVLRSVLRM